jgi:hypothetical protein
MGIMTGCTTAGLCQTWANITENPHLHIQRIFQGGCLTDDMSKPLALILSSTMDWNQAFSLTAQWEQDVFANLARNYTVCHRYIQDSTDDSMEQLGIRKKIDVLLMRAHGKPLFQEYANELISPYSGAKFFAVFGSVLSAYATIILDSCLNAATCGIDDFAGFIRSIAPPEATVYAPTRRSDWLEIQSGSPPTVKMSFKGMDVTYRSGTDGYCNNPLDSTEAELEKLKSMCLLAEKNQGIDAAISAASKSFKSSDFAIRNAAIDLFEKLFEKGHGFEAAANAASEALKSSDTKTRNKAIQLFEKMFEKGQGLDAAIAAAPNDKAIDSFKKQFEKKAKQRCGARNCPASGKL